jgi:hypothetical protein
MATLNNPHDNSEHLAVTNKKDLYSVASTGTDGELEDHIRYYKYLQMRSKLSGGKDEQHIKIDGKDVAIADLLPADSEFEVERIRVLVLLNKLGPDDALVHQLQRDFGTNSIFELASEYANYSLGRSRGEKLYAILHGKGDTAGNIYDGLTGAKQTEARADLRSGKFTHGYKGSRDI